MRNEHRAPRSVVWVSSPDLQQLAPSLFRLRIPGGRAHLLNCYLWLAPDGVTLIDTGWPDSAELIEQALHQLGRVAQTSSGSCSPIFTRTMWEPRPR